MSNGTIRFVCVLGTLMLLDDVENSLKAMKHALTMAADQPIVLLNTAVLCYRSGSQKDAADLLLKFEEVIVETNNGLQPEEVRF